MVNSVKFLCPFDGAIVTVTLPEHWNQFIRDALRSGRYSSDTAVLEEALGLLKERERSLEPPSRNGAAPKPIGDMIDDVMRDLPDEVLERLPVDGAAEHDHFIYGTPKRGS